MLSSIIMSLSNLGLDAFLQIYREGTVQGAAKSLGLTPTAITQRVRSLEKDLNTTLFLRTKKGMLLTDAGKKLLQFAQAKEVMESDILSKISSEARVSPIILRFSASTYYTYSKLLPIAEKLKTKYEHLYFDFDVDDNDDKIEKLKEGKTDFIIIPREAVPLEFDSKLLKKRKYVLVGGSHFKKSKKDPVIIDYAKKDPFTDMFFKKLKIKYNQLKNRHYVNNTLMIPKLIEANLGVAVLDEEHFKQAKARYKIFNLYPSKFYEIEWAIVWMPRLEMPGYINDLVSEF